MSSHQYAQLCQMLQDVASEVLNDQEPACDFSEDDTFFDAENYSELWEDRS